MKGSIGGNDNNRQKKQGMRIRDCIIGKIFKIWRWNERVTESLTQNIDMFRQFDFLVTNTPKFTLTGKIQEFEIKF